MLRVRRSVLRVGRAVLRVRRTGGGGVSGMGISRCGAVAHCCMTAVTGGRSRGVAGVWIRGGAGRTVAGVWIRGGT